jgi:hypothetical protein
LFSATFDRYCGTLLALPDFSGILSTNELPVRISFPNARELKLGEDNLGGSVGTAAGVASTLPRMSTNARPLRFNRTRATQSDFGRPPWNGYPTRWPPHPKSSFS